MFAVPAAWAVGEQILLFPSHGGGALNLQSPDGAYHLWDIKGQPVAGESVSGDYKVQFGGIYLAVMGEIGGQPEGDNGLIRNTRISRDGQNIKLEWEYAPGSGITRADIWRLTGQEFVKEGNWLKIFSNQPVTSWVDNIPLALNQPPAVVVGNNMNAYYRVVPTGTVRANIFLPSNNARTVAKIDIKVEKNGGIKLIGLPLYAGKVSGTFLGQVPQGQEIILYPKSGTGLDYVKVKSDAVVGRDFDISPTIGFWQKNPNANDITITFVGSLESSARTSNLAAKDLTSNPVAVSVPSNLLGSNDDVIYPQAGKGLDYFKKSGGGWGVNFATLALNQGFWYKGAGNRRWNINPAVPSAVIE